MTVHIRSRTLAMAGIFFIGGLVGTVATRSQPSSGPAATASSSAIAQWLKLDPQQTAELETSDPGFLADLTTLRSRLSAERDALAALFF